MPSIPNELLNTPDVVVDINKPYTHLFRGSAVGSLLHLSISVSTTDILSDLCYIHPYHTWNFSLSIHRLAT